LVWLLRWTLANHTFLAIFYTFCWSNYSYLCSQDLAVKNAKLILISYIILTIIYLIFYPNRPIFSTQIDQFFRPKSTKNLAPPKILIGVLINLFPSRLHWPKRGGTRWDRNDLTLFSVQRGPIWWNIHVGRNFKKVFLRPVPLFLLSTHKQCVLSHFIHNSSQCFPKSLISWRDSNPGLLIA
jgi:hypothetical protein